MPLDLKNAQYIYLYINSFQFIYSTFNTSLLFTKCVNSAQIKILNGSNDYKDHLFCQIDYYYPILLPVTILTLDCLDAFK